MSRVVIYSNWLTYHIVTNGLLPMCAYIHTYVVFRRKGPVWHGRSAKTVLYIHISGGRDPYGTGGVRRRCYIHIYPEEGTRMARAECEDGAIHIYL